MNYKEFNYFCPYSWDGLSLEDIGPIKPFGLDL